MTLGKALLEYREGPDPGDRVKERREKLAKAEKLKQGRKDRLAKGQAKKKEAATASPINQGVVTLGAEAEAQCQSPGAEHSVNSEEFEMETLPWASAILRLHAPERSLIDPAGGQLGEYDLIVVAVGR